MSSPVPSRELFVFDLGVEDALWSKTMYILIVFTYATLGIMFSAKHLNISGKMDKIECNPSFMTFMWMFSWIFGKSSEEQIQKCMSNQSKILVQNMQTPLISKINAEKTAFDKKMEVYDSNLVKLQNSYDKSEGRVTNLAIAIQNNILAIKEGMQKIIAAAIVQSRMTKGAMSVVKTTNTNLDELKKRVDKM
jgi:hypothetical protein